MDITSVTTILTTGLTAVAAIGVAALGLAATVKLYKIVRGAL
ncbi:major capsid protein [Pseudomonas tremae]|nr:major capsid protein [Pseudomonas tremae]MCQ2990928.1 major capsid protein [Pseudomonas tremae]